jgi:hypothetical protein
MKKLIFTLLLLIITLTVSAQADLKQVVISQTSLTFKVMEEVFFNGILLSARLTGYTPNNGTKVFLYDNKYLLYTKKDNIVYSQTEVAPIIMEHVNND